MREMRLLSLCSLGAAQPVLSYKQISDAQGFAVLDAEQVEGLVVDAISQDLLEATMDQFKSEVTISSCSYRSFGPDQWRLLQSKLQGLSVNVATVLEAIKRHEAPPTPN